MKATAQRTAVTHGPAGGQETVGASVRPKVASRNYAGIRPSMHRKTRPTTRDPERLPPLLHQTTPDPVCRFGMSDVVDNAVGGR